MSWCTSGVGLQDLPFIDNRHLESIPCFQLLPCYSSTIHIFILLLIKVAVKKMAYFVVSVFTNNIDVGFSQRIV